MRSSKRIKLLPLTLFLLFAAACTPRNVILEVPVNIHEKIAGANSSVCAYKGRVGVIYEKGKEDVRFRGYLDKDCQDNFNLKILGLFNSVAYDVSYEDGEVQAYQKGEDVSLRMAYFMRSKGLDSMVSLIRYPHAEVDSSYRVKPIADEYILTKGMVTVAAGTDLLIRRISFGSETFEYSYNEGKLSRLKYEGGGARVEIKLQ